MSNWPKALVVATLLVLVAAFGLIACCPNLFGTRISYFDTQNGRVKLQLVSFGHVYRETVKETEYSRLLKQVGFQEAPAEWKLATQEELGLRRLFHATYVDYYEGKIEADSKIFALTISLDKPSEGRTRELVEQFRALVRNGDCWKVREFVTQLQNNGLK